MITVLVRPEGQEGFVVPFSKAFSLPFAELQNNALLEEAFRIRVEHVMSDALKKLVGGRIVSIAYTYVP